MEKENGEIYLKEQVSFILFINKIKIYLVWFGFRGLFKIYSYVVTICVFFAGLKRCGKSCRLRWLNYLRPDIKRGNISHDEEELIIRLHKLLGNRWSLIAGRLPGRTDNEIKNYWNTNIGKKLQDQHQSPCPSTRKPSSQSPKKPKFIPEKSTTKPPRPHADFQPIRTRATKCTKVIITTPGPQNCQVIKYPDTKQVAVDQPDSMLVKNTVVNDHNVIKGLDSFPEFDLGENHTSDFLTGLEMEVNFLSEFLNSDLAELANFDTNGGDNSTSSTNTCERGYSSPNSDHDQEYKLQDTDLSFMDSIIGSELGWF